MQCSAGGISGAVKQLFHNPEVMTAPRLVQTRALIKQLYCVGSEFERAIMGFKPAKPRVAITPL